MAEDCLVFKKIEKGYTVGDSQLKNDLGKTQHHNGIAEKCVNSIENIVIPRTYENEPVYSLTYRCFSFLPALKTAYIPNSILSLNGDTFLNSVCLQSVVFEENMKITSFSIFSFFGTNLTSIDIPRSVTFFDEKTFAIMKNLRAIYVHSFIKEMSSNVFADTDTSKITIYVPKNYRNETMFGFPINKVLDVYKNNRITKCICKTHSITYNIIYIIIINS